MALYAHRYVAIMYTQGVGSKIWLIMHDDAIDVIWKTLNNCVAS